MIDPLSSLSCILALAFLFLKKFNSIVHKSGLKFLEVGLVILNRICSHEKFVAAPPTLSCRNRHENSHRKTIGAGDSS